MKLKLKTELYKCCLNSLTQRSPQMPFTRFKLNLLSKRQRFKELLLVARNKTNGFILLCVGQMRRITTFTFKGLKMNLFQTVRSEGLSIADTHLLQSTEPVCNTSLFRIIRKNNFHAPAIYPHFKLLSNTL